MSTSIHIRVASVLVRYRTPRCRSVVTACLSSHIVVYSIYRYSAYLRNVLFESPTTPGCSTSRRKTRQLDTERQRPAMLRHPQDHDPLFLFYFFARARISGVAPAGSIPIPPTQGPEGYGSLEGAGLPSPHSDDNLRQRNRQRRQPFLESDSCCAPKTPPPVLGTM